MKKLMTAVILLWMVASTGFASENKIGIHGGAGTDINLGLAIGAGGSYLLTDEVGFDMEISAFLFYSHSVDNYTEGIYNYRYTETTEMFIFPVLVNVLFGYTPEKTSTFFFAGTGVMATSIDWEISSTDDSTANNSFDGASGGLLVNLGLGGAIKRNFEIRVQTPVFIVFAEYKTLISPMFVVLAGYRI